jgi:hypothetical protein
MCTGRLNHLVRRVAERTIGLERLPIRVRVHDVHDAAGNQERAAQKAKRHPKQAVFFQITVVPRHEGLHGTCEIAIDVALSESNVHRRRPGEEGKPKDTRAPDKREREQYSCDGKERVPQNGGNSDLPDNVSSVAQRAVRLKRGAGRMDVCCLNQRGAGKKHTANQRKGSPDGTAVTPREATPWHDSQSIP